MTQTDKILIHTLESIAGEADRKKSMSESEQGAISTLFELHTFRK